MTALFSVGRDGCDLCVYDGFCPAGSLIVTAGLALTAAILPSKWLRDGFAYKGFIFIIVGSIAAYLLQKNLRYEFPSTQMLMFNLVIPLALIALFIAVSHVWVPLQKVLLDIQDRISIMLYIYVPIGVVSLFFPRCLRPIPPWDMPKTN